MLNYEQDPEQMLFMTIQEYREGRFISFITGLGIGIFATAVGMLGFLFAFGG